MTSKLKSATEIVSEELIKIYKIFDKLEKRIAKLEKVLESHAKCIGQLRGDKNES
jgi:DNA anti-recombination protein RmuC